MGFIRRLHVRCTAFYGPKLILCSYSVALSLMLVSALAFNSSIWSTYYRRLVPESAIKKFPMIHQMLTVLDPYILIQIGSVCFGLSILIIIATVLCIFIVTLFVLLCNTNVYFLRYQRKPLAIVLVPGDGGSQAFARMRNDPSNNFLIWVNLRYFLTPATLGRYFGLVFNPNTNKSTDGDLATIEFPGWGDTSTIENLDTFEHTKTQYFGPLVSKLTKLNPDFYVRNKTVRGCPYDFRYAPDENNHFNKDLQKLIEETYVNSGARIILLGHSMGVIYSLHFLNSIPDSWKKTYLKAFIATSGPLGGAVKALRISCSGDNLGVFIESPLNYRPVQRSMTSTSFLVPDERLWLKDEILVYTPDKNYSAHDYQQLFKDINFTQGFVTRQNARQVVDSLRTPTGVDELYCVYGLNISTAESIVYQPPSYFHGQFPDQQPTINYGNGDGTVNQRSLEKCLEWPNVKSQVLPQAEHLQILSDQRFIDYVTSITEAEPPKSFLNEILWSFRDNENDSI